jgi:serine O-acetyltransferase
LGGIIVNGYARFGDNCRICSGRVVGLAHAEDQRASVIGNNIDVGVRVVLLGMIRIGNNARIDENAVIVDDLSDDSITVDVSARVRARRFPPASTP